MESSVIDATKRCPGVGSANHPIAHPNGMESSPDGVRVWPLYDATVPLELRDEKYAFANSCDLRAMAELIPDVPFVDMCLAANALIPEYTVIFAKHASSRHDYNPAGEPCTPPPPTRTARSIFFSP